MDNFQARSSQIGRDYETHVAEWVIAHGWTILGRNVRHQSGIEIDILAVDLSGERVGIECKGGELERTAGLRRSDNIWKVLGQTLALHNWNRAQTSPVDRLRFLVITTAIPDDSEPLRVAEAEGQVTIVVVP